MKGIKEGSSVNPYATNGRYITSYGADVMKEYSLYDDMGRKIGIGTMSKGPSGPVKNAPENSYSIDWIENIAAENGAGNGVHGVTRDVYNTMVDQATRGGSEGVVTGSYLLEPEKTESVTSHFPFEILKEKPKSKHGSEVRLLTGTTGDAMPMEVDGRFISGHFGKADSKLYGFEWRRNPETGKLE